MEIKYSNQKPITLSELPYGELYQFERTIYLKIDNGRLNNAFDVEYKRLRSIKGDVLVYPKKGFLTIED